MKKTQEDKDIAMSVIRDQPQEAENNRSFCLQCRRAVGRIN